MASTIDKSLTSPTLKTQKLFLTQIFFRILLIVLTLGAAWITFTSKETTSIFGIQVDARYSYSPAFKFFAYANVIACVFSVLSLAFIVASKAGDSTYYFYMFQHDLIITLLLMAGSAASSAVGYIGKYGNDHTGWIAICDHFTNFCNRITVASALSYFAMLFYILLTIISANKSRKI